MGTKLSGLHRLCYESYSKIFYKMHTKALRRMTIYTSPDFTDWLDDVGPFVCVFVNTCSISFGRFRMSKFAFGWRPRWRACTSLYKFVWVKFLNPNLCEKKTDYTVHNCYWVYRLRGPVFWTEYSVLDTGSVSILRFEGGQYLARWVRWNELTLFTRPVTRSVTSDQVQWLRIAVSNRSN